MNNTNLRVEMFKKQAEAMEAELTPFGFIDTGLEGTPDTAKPQFQVEAGDVWFSGTPNEEIGKLKKTWLENQ
jgi:hypothetical protein